MAFLSVTFIYASEELDFSAASDRLDSGAPSATVVLPSGTQGPLWPPSEAANSDGDFVVVGNIIAEHQPGAVFPAPGAAVVSKNTVPPLDANGVEDFSNGFSNVTTPYTVIRQLDLSPGSPDLDMVLYTSSFGPASGNFGDGPRIPAQGVSQYNLNPFPPVCRALFPGSSQERGG